MNVSIEQCVNDSIRIFCATPKSLTYRKHASNDVSTNNEKDLGADVDVPINSQLTLQDITLEMQRSENVPRMSGEELLTLLGLNNKPMSDDSERNFITPQKSKAIAIDVRSKTEYKMGALPESINIPFNGKIFTYFRLNPR